jgi:uncharacterized Zn-finger protein
MPSKAGAAVASAGIMPLIVAGAGVALVVGLGGWLAVRGAKDLAATVVDTTSTAAKGFWGGVLDIDPRTRHATTEQIEEGHQRVVEFDWDEFYLRQEQTMFALDHPVEHPRVWIDLNAPDTKTTAHKTGGLFSCGSSPGNWKGAFNPFTMLCDIPSKFIRQDYYDGS